MTRLLWKFRAYRLATRMILLGGLVLTLCACGAVPETVQDTGDQGAQAGPTGEAQEKLMPDRPVLAMPADPPERSNDQMWDEADRRSEHVRSQVEQEIASVSPGPYPEPKKPKQPRETKKDKAPTKTAEPKRDPAKTTSKTTLAVPKAEVPDLTLVEKFTTDDGLPANLVTAIYADETDLWVGTSGGGVARYNFAEQNWMVTREEDGLVSDHVTDIVKFKGKMYVGTKRGISIWDGFGWESIEEQENVQLLNTAFQIADATLWIAARNMRGGLLTFDGEKWKNKSGMRPGMVLNNVSSLAFDGKDIWLGTTSRGVYAKQGRDWKVFNVSDGIASNFVYTLAVRGGRCYLGGCCGLSYYDGVAWVIFDVPEGLPHSTVNDIAMDGDIVWLGSKNGLSAFDGEEFTNFFAEDGLLADNRITSLFVSGDSLWVGTAGGLTHLKMSF